MTNKIESTKELTLEEALKSKVIGEAELRVISRNIHLVPAKDLKRLGLDEPKKATAKKAK